MIRNFSLMLALLALHTLQVCAQSSTKADAILHQKSLRLTLGTQGIGAEYSYGIHRKVALRGGLSFLPVSANNVYKISGFNSTSDVSAHFSNVHLLADYTPFQNASAFRLVGGLAYFMKANGTLKIRPVDNYTYGDIVLTPEQVGVVDMRTDWKGIAPYLGLGIFKAFPKNRFNVNLDLGAYYLKRPDAEIVGTGLLEGNSTQTAQLNENIKDYRFLPSLQLNFSYKL